MTRSSGPRSSRRRRTTHVCSAISTRSDIPRMMPERYKWDRTIGRLDGGGRASEPRRSAVRMLGSVPPVMRRWRRTLRSGLFWTALGLGSASISYALNMDVAARSLGFDRTLASVFLALVPIPALALGVHGLALSLRLRAASLLADRTADYLSEHLPDADPLVAFTGAGLGDVSRSSVQALAGMDAMVDRLVRGARGDGVPARTSALADTLAEPVRLAAV